MASAWIAHVKAYSKKYNMSYSQALKQAKSSSYKKKIFIFLNEF